MKKFITILCVLFTACSFAFAQAPQNENKVPQNENKAAQAEDKAAQAEDKAAQTEPKAPELEYCLRLHVTLGQAYSVGQTPKGMRNIVPITGGTFEGNLPGKELKGEIIPGGADYQMSSEGRTDVEAIYCIRTDDGVNIHVRNCGIIAMSDGLYFRCAPKFEAPTDSKYNWMNNSLFLCQPSFGGSDGGITLDVWRVK